MPSASRLYRVAGIVILLFAVAHTAFFRQSDPSWGVSGVIASMRSVHFDAQGLDRSYWDLFAGLGYSVGALLVFVAILAWQLGGVSPSELVALRHTGWALAGCFAVLAILNWRYVFVLPATLSIVIAMLLAAAAWRTQGPANG